MASSCIEKCPWIETIGKAIIMDGIVAEPIIGVFSFPNKHKNTSQELEVVKKAMENCPGSIKVITNTTEGIIRRKTVQIIVWGCGLDQGFSDYLPKESVRTSS